MSEGRSFGISRCRIIRGGTAGVCAGALGVRTRALTSEVLQLLGRRMLQSLGWGCVGGGFRRTGPTAGILERKGSSRKGLGPTVQFADLPVSPVIILGSHQRSLLCVVVLRTVFFVCLFWFIFPRK